MDSTYIGKETRSDVFVLQIRKVYRTSEASQFQIQKFEAVLILVAFLIILGTGAEKTAPDLFSRWCWMSIHSSVGKECACNAGDPGSIPGVGRSATEGIGYCSSILGLSWWLSS